MKPAARPFSNGLCPAEAERLALLAEEAGEVIQAIGKILRHGYESRHPKEIETNRETLARELGNLHAAAELMIYATDLDPAKIEVSQRDKWRDLRLWTHHQAGLL